MRNNIQPKRFRNVLSGNAKVGGIKSAEYGLL